MNKANEKGLFLQNIIALIWDFDKTLSPHYMQAPLFEAYGVDEAAFWREVRALPDYYARAGIHVDRDTCYLGHLLTYVREGVMDGLSNARLRELGASIQLYPGVIGLFDRLSVITSESEFCDGDLRLEHYVVSTGLAEMIKGAPFAAKLSGIWASEFIETPAPPHAVLAGAPAVGSISQIAGFLNNTTKTRAIFEINKGVNKKKDISVNQSIAEEDRRVPIRNMIYIADGPSDIPSFSVVRKHGGQAYAVYDPDSEESFVQVENLLRNGRVDDYGPTDYQEGSKTDMWLQLQVRRIARRMMSDRRRALDGRLGQSPEHLAE